MADSEYIGDTRGYHAGVVTRPVHAPSPGVGARQGDPGSLSHTPFGVVPFPPLLPFVAASPSNDDDDTALPTTTPTPTTGSNEHERNARGSFLLPPISSGSESSSSPTQSH
jgi:hypothetical protein